MTIQEATEICLSREGKLARPTSWGKNGSAIDLARRFDPDRILKLTSLGSPQNLRGWDWKPAPEEFLDWWEIVSVEQLTQEVCQTGK